MDGKSGNQRKLVKAERGISGNPSTAKFQEKKVFSTISMQRSQLRHRTRKCLSDLAAKLFLAFSRIGLVEQGHRSQIAVS